MEDRKKTILRRIDTVLRNQTVIILTFAMIVTLIPSVGEAVYADEVTQPPSSDTYIEVSAFNTADTDYGLTTGKNPQAVYFGTNGDSSQKQKWWIAGYDNRGLVLMCDPNQPLKTGQTFNNLTSQGKYNSKHGTYENTSVDTINPNHYGASGIRGVLNSIAADGSYFTQAEQKMMKETTVCTFDFYNNETYSTTDKLYLAAGCYNSSEITVGQNAVDSSKTGNEQVRNGLKIELKKGGLNGSPFTEDASSNFWTRSPADDLSSLALHAVTSIGVLAGTIDQTRDAVVPAFALDPDTILFASSAAAGTSSAALDGDNAMTFRCDGAAGISSTATFTDDSITVDYDAADSAVYLYVQGGEEAGDWVSSRRIEGSVNIAASSIRSDANLTNCKIWLETVDDNIVYAKPARFTGAFPPPLYGIIDPPAAESFTYTGEQIDGIRGVPGCSISGPFLGTSVGIYIVTATLEDGYIWSDGTTDPKAIIWEILQAENPMKLKTKTATVRKSKLRKKKQTLERSKVLTFTRSAKGKVTYTKLSGSGKLSISGTTGKITVRKKTGKGTYRIRVRVSAAGDDCYSALSKTVTLKVRVK